MRKFNLKYNLKCETTRIIITHRLLAPAVSWRNETLPCHASPRTFASLMKVPSDFKCAPAQLGRFLNCFCSHLEWRTSSLSRHPSCIVQKLYVKLLWLGFILLLKYDFSMIAVLWVTWIKTPCVAQIHPLRSIKNVDFFRLGLYLLLK